MSSYIQRLELENFQSHKHSVFEFSPGFNIIIGPNFSGKSSVVRTLDFLFFNNPAGTSFVRQGTSLTKVKAVMDDGIILVRERGKSLNRYTLIVDGKESVYENFGREVPQEIKERLQLFYVFLDADRKLNVNFMHAHEGLFLLTSPPSDRARILGVLSGTCIIDVCLRKLNQLQRENSMKKEMLKQEILEYEKELIQYQDIPEKLKILAEVESKIVSYEKVQQDFLYLRELGTNFSSITDNYDKINFKLDGIYKINFDKLFDIFVSIELFMKLYNEFITNEEKLITIESRIFSLEQEFNKIKDTYKFLLIQTKVCPVCGNLINEETLEKCLNEF